MSRLLGCANDKCMDAPDIVLDRHEPDSALWYGPAMFKALCITTV